MSLVHDKLNEMHDILTTLAYKFQCLLKVYFLSDKKTHTCVTYELLLVWLFKILDVLYGNRIRFLSRLMLSTTLTLYLLTLRIW